MKIIILQGGANNGKTLARMAAIEQHKQMEADLRKLGKQMSESAEQLVKTMEETERQMSMLKISYYKGKCYEPKYKFHK